MSATIKPEWLGNLETQLEQYPKFVSYALSTLSPEGRPKVRFVIHRGGLLLTTTDTRMQKPNHLAHDPTIEIAWWIEDPAIQFRITGKAYTIPTDKSEVQGVLDKIGLEGEDSKADFWEEKRQDLWKNLSGHLRGSFGRPPPGKKLDEIEEKPEDWISRLDVESDDPKQKKDIEWAQSHFALIAIKPENAEMLELKPTPNIRTQYNKQEDGSWEKVSVAP